MGGTKVGGKKAAQSNIERYGKDYYARLGSKGGKVGRSGGFYGQPEIARAMGAVGGLLSRKTKPADKAKIKKDKAFQAAYANLIKVQEKAREARKARDEQA